MHIAPDNITAGWESCADMLNNNPEFQKYKNIKGPSARKTYDLIVKDVLKATGVSSTGANISALHEEHENENEHVDVKRKRQLFKLVLEMHKDREKMDSADAANKAKATQTKCQMIHVENSLLGVNIALPTAPGSALSSVFIDQVGDTFGGTPPTSSKVHLHTTIIDMGGDPHDSPKTGSSGDPDSAPTSAIKKRGRTAEDDVGSSMKVMANSAAVYQTHIQNKDALELLKAQNEAKRLELDEKRMQMEMANAAAERANAAAEREDRAKDRAFMMSLMADKMGASRRNP